MSLVVIYANWNIFVSEWIVAGCMDAQRGWRMHGNNGSEGRQTQRGWSDDLNRLLYVQIWRPMSGDNDFGNKICYFISDRFPRNI
jgi:hypothetical protein